VYFGYFGSDSVSTLNYSLQYLSSYRSRDRETELRNIITWRKEDNDRGGRRPGGRGGQQKRGESETLEEGWATATESGRYEI
jgi:hypothetical protein